MADERRVVFAVFIEKMGAGDLAQSLPQIDQSIQRADGQTEQVDVFGEMVCHAFEGKVVTSGKNDRGELALRQDHFLQEESVTFGAIEFFGHFAGAARFADFDQSGGFQRKDVMPHPGGRLFQGPCEKRECGGCRHEQAQNVHAARVSQQFDFVERIDGGDSFH